MLKKYCDLQGAARVFRDSGANGNDLLTLTMEALEEDLRMSRFGARKVIAARDAFLEGRQNAFL